MQSGKCPSCGSIEVYKKFIGGYRAYLAISTWKGAKLEDFVCTQCGFVESYILDKNARELIKKNWERVPVQ